MDRSNLADSLAKEKVALITIGDVFDEVDRLADENLEIDSELADILENILGERMSDAKRARDLLNLERQNYDDDWLETEISKIADGEKFETMSLNKEDLQQLLDELERAEVLRTDRQEIASSLANKYGVSENQVKEWLNRLSMYEKSLQEQGLSKGTARDVAKKAVIREERMVGEIVKVTEIDRQEAIGIARQTIEKTIEIKKVIGKSDLDKISKTIAVNLRSRVEPIIVKQSERLPKIIEVAGYVENETQILVNGLEEQLALSQPNIVFERHKREIEELSRKTIESIWAGKNDNDMGNAEIVIGEGENVRRVNFKKEVKNILETNDGTVDIVIKQTNGVVSETIKRNQSLAAEYETGNRIEEIADTIIDLNPKLDLRVVTDYATKVVGVTRTIEIPGERMGRSISGEYGLNESASGKTNLLLRVITGSADSSELTTNIKSLESQGVDIKSQVLSPEGRAVSSFLGDIKNNPLLSRGMGAIKKQLMSKFLGSQVAVEGAGGFLTKAGFSTVFGVETTTLVPTLLGFFAEGGTIGSAITGIAEAGSVSAWIKGILAASKVAGAVGKTAAVAGGAAATEGTKLALKETGKQLATKVAGLLGLQAIPGLGQAITIGLAVISGIKLAVKGIEGFLGKIGIDLKKLRLGPKIKKFFREDLNLGKFGDLIAVPASVGGFLLTLPFLALTSAFATLSKMIAPILISVIVGVFVYQTLVPSQLASSLAPTANMIAGISGDGIYTDVDPIFGEDCELTLACVVLEALMQNGFVRVVKNNVEKAALVLRATIGKFSFFDIARFIAVMVYNTKRFDAFQCIGYAIAATSGLTTSPSWESLYAGTQSGCVKVAPENAGLGDLIVFPLKNGHYHIGALTAVRQDGSGVMYDVNTDGNGLLHKWPILNIGNFVGGDNSRNPGQSLTILRCGV